MTRTGKFKKPLTYTDNLGDYFNRYVLKNCGQISEICAKFGLTPSQVQNIMREFSLKKEWSFRDSTSINVAHGRAAEIFIKELPDFRVLADKIKTDSKHPFDLILRPNQELFQNWRGIEQIGAVDVKMTHRRKTESGTHRWKFNIQGICRPTKYAFLVGYDETSTHPMVLLILPYKEVKGKSSISVACESLQTSKYAEYVYKTWEVPESEDSTSE
jgi:antitoxin component of RelBE/YafQ-DinJ toxin-antitoxin module